MMAEPLEYFTPEPDPIPGDLKAVAWVFIGLGIVAAFDLFAEVVLGAWSLSFSILEILLGCGILNLSPRWRRWGLVFNWIWMIVAGLYLFWLLGSGVLSGEPALGLLGLLIIGSLIAINAWQYRVLTRPNVRRLFGLM